MTGYKSYQQVFSLSIRPSSPAKVKKTKTPKPQPKLRTKTGCLTCRKRKKKCDEHIVDGKCQGCTRNFLDCSWPVLHQLQQQEKQNTPEPMVLKSPLPSIGRKSSVSSESSDSSDRSDTSHFSLSRDSMLSPRDSYPSPKSPSLDDMPIKLPPLRFMTKANPQPLQPAKEHQFVITSVNDDRLCAIKQ